MAPTRSRLRRILFAMLLGVVSAPLLLEFSLRIVGGAAPQPRTYAGEHEARPGAHFVADPELGWHMLPGTQLQYPTEGRQCTYLADARGFRCDPNAREKGARRLALLGDSFAWGAGVEYSETFGALTARELGDWSVSNWGMPGFGVDQIAQTLRLRALPEQPDLVLVAMYAWDFQRSLCAFREPEGMNKPVYRLEDGALMPRPIDDKPWALWRLLDEHSHAFTAAKLLSWRLARRFPHGEWWHLNRALIERMIDDCQAAGVPIAFVHIPTTSWRSFPALKELCLRREVPWLDLAANVSEPPAGIYYPVDKHLNAAGHQHFATQIASWLRAP